MGKRSWDNKNFFFKNCILLIVLGMFFVFSESKWKIPATCCSFVFIINIMCRKKIDKISYLYIIEFFILVSYVSCLINVKNVMLENNVFFLLRNTQSYFYNDNYRVHKDCLIYILLRNKTAVVQDKNDWFYKYIEMFSGNTVIDKSISKIIIDKEDYENVGQMHMVACQDLFSEQVYAILQQKSINSDYQNLYVKLEGFLEANEILVLADDEYNLYLEPYEK